MHPALWIGKTGLDAQQTRMGVISNNLANASTTAFKRGRAEFADLIYQNQRQVGGQNAENANLPSGLMLGTGVRVVATDKQFTQGNMVATSNALDVAIDGRGFFQVVLPDGQIAYSRDGSFQINDQGQLVTSNGYQIAGGLAIPAATQSVTIGVDGSVSAQLAGEAAPQELGQLLLADFVNPTGLQAAGDNLYLESAASGAPQPGQPGLNGLGRLKQGYLEGSNVNVVEELVNMIETQRAYEMSSKAISTADQMLQYVSNNL